MFIYLIEVLEITECEALQQPAHDHLFLQFYFTDLFHWASRRNEE